MVLFDVVLCPLWHCPVSNDSKRPLHEYNEFGLKISGWLLINPNENGAYGEGLKSHRGIEKLIIN